MGNTEFNESFFQEMSHWPAVEGLCVAAAEDIADDIRRTAPTDTHAYVDGVTVVVKRQKRSVALVLLTDRKSLLIEAKLGIAVRALQRAKRRGRG